MESNTFPVTFHWLLDHEVFTALGYNSPKLGHWSGAKTPYLGAEFIDDHCRAFTHRLKLLDHQNQPTDARPKPIKWWQFSTTAW